MGASRPIPVFVGSDIFFSVANPCLCYIGQEYLKADDFCTVFQMSIAEFYAMPKWKQISKKKQAGLF